MKFNDYYNTILEAKRGKEPKSNVQLPDGTWRRVNSDGDVLYTKNKNRVDYHRLDGPAVEWLDGSKAWWVNGYRHRIDGPAIEYASGRKAWWVNGYLHRLDGPAIIGTDGSKRWYVNNKLHRLDGPAIEWLGGGRQWFVDGKEYSEEEFNTIFGVSKDPAILKQRAASSDLFR